MNNKRARSNLSPSFKQSSINSLFAIYLRKTKTMMTQIINFNAMNKLWQWVSSIMATLITASVLYTATSISDVKRDVAVMKASYLTQKEVSEQLSLHKKDMAVEVSFINGRHEALRDKVNSNCWEIKILKDK